MHSPLKTSLFQSRIGIKLLNTTVKINLWVASHFKFLHLYLLMDPMTSN